MQPPVCSHLTVLCGFSNLDLHYFSMGRCSSNVRDATEAAKGCDSNIQGHIFPSQSSWTGNKRMRALEELHESDRMSHEELMDLREPFVFHFNCNML